MKKKTGSNRSNPPITSITSTAMCFYFLLLRVSYLFTNAASGVPPERRADNASR